MLSFAKEEVRAPPPGSLRLEPVVPPQAPPRPPSGSSSSAYVLGVGRGFSVSTVVAATVRECGSRGKHLGPGPYDLHVADDEGRVDGDFPALDGSVCITGVGAVSFVLCSGDAPLLRLGVPAGEEVEGPLHVTGVLDGGEGPSFSFDLPPA